jgi:membrane protease YdiL (CAAX protease family)
MMDEIAWTAVVGTLIASVILWTAALRIWQSGRPLIPIQSHSTPWGVVDLAIAIGIWVACIGFADAVRLFITGTDSRGPLDALDPTAQIVVLWISGLATLGICVLIAAALFVRHRVTLSDLGWNSQHVASDVVLGLKAFAMLAPIVYGIQLLLTRLVESKHPLIEMLKSNPRIEFVLVVGFAAVIVAPVAEEFLFRVLLQSWLERMFSGRESTESLIFGGHQNKPQPPQLNVEEVPVEAVLVAEASASAANVPDKNPYLSPRDFDASKPRDVASGVGRVQIVPIVLSSVFFALSHYSHGPDPIPLFVFALGLGYLYQRTHRILPCIVLHFLLNACSLAALWMVIFQH